MPKVTVREIVETILKGIDKDECESSDGWWETSTGAEFGKVKKEELIAALEKAGRYV